MKVLITGGAGFIGSHLVEAYLKSDFEVAVIDNGDIYRLTTILSKIKFYPVDITSSELKHVFNEFQPDVVNHHAALINVRQSMNQPTTYAFNNVFGTIKILELCKQFQVKQLLFASSVAVYGDVHSFPIKEETRCKPVSFYGLDKYCCEQYINLYAKDFKTCIFRYANVYGPRQTSTGEGGVIAIFAEAIAKQQALNIFGSGRQTRDFIYVKDVAVANILATQCGCSGLMHISSQKEVSIAELAQTMMQIATYNCEITYMKKRQGDIDRSLLDNYKAQTILHWKPRYELESGLDETLHYYQSL